MWKRGSCHLTGGSLRGNDFQRLPWRGGVQLVLCENVMRIEWMRLFFRPRVGENATAVRFCGRSKTPFFGSRRA